MLFPKARWGPWNDYPKIVWVLVGAHHLLGLLGGPFAHFYLIDDPDFQFLVWLLLACYLPAVLSYPLHPFGDVTISGTTVFVANAVIYYFGFVVTVYCRCVLFPPVAYRL